MAGLVIVVLGLSPNTSYAEPIEPSLAIIDTGLDQSTFHLYQNNVIHEVCITQFYNCPGDVSYLEGSGSSQIPKRVVDRNGGMRHGTDMLISAIKGNPNINVVFIRAIAYDKFGYRLGLSASHLVSVFDWIEKNKDIYNIKAVSLSQGHHNFTKQTNYCPVGHPIEQSINKVKDSNILTFVAAGNNGDKSRVDFPACLPNALGVSAVNINNELDPYSNYDQNIKVVKEIGTVSYVLNKKKYKASGTSVSAQIAASKYINSLGGYNE